MNESNLVETFVSSKEIFDGRILHLFDDSVQLPNGQSASREVIRHVGAVCVIPLLSDGRVIVERQFRYPIDQVMTEIPAGKLDSPDEDPLEAAKRELREETGYVADRFIHLGVFYPAAAYCDEKINMYLALDLHEGDQDLDPDEFLTVLTVPLQELVDDVMSGKITDAKTQTAVLKVNYLLQQGKI